MSELEIKQSPIDEMDGAQRVELTGAIDGSSITDLTDFVDRLYEEGTRWFLVDMTGIKYVNSTGLGSLVKYADQFRSRGGGMVLFSVPPKVKVIIKMLGLDRFFPIENSLSDALEAARSNGESEAEPEVSEAAAKADASAPAATDSAAAPVAATSRPASDGNGAAISGDALAGLIAEQQRTNRLLKAMILELRQLRADLDEDDD